MKAQSSLMPTEMPNHLSSKKRPNRLLKIKQGKPVKTRRERGRSLKLRPDKLLKLKSRKRLKLGLEILLKLLQGTLMKR